jgi:hypothetical protein
MSTQASATGSAVLPILEFKVIPRQPSYLVKGDMLKAARAVLAEGFDYRESMAIFRAHLLAAALDQCGRSQKKASARMRISRECLRQASARAREIAL